MERAGQAIVIVAAISATAAVGLADLEIRPHDVATVFFVTKSDDRNRVDYGVRLDADCRPEGDQPMFAYWRELEPGGTNHGLNPFEQRFYGVARQERIDRGERGGALRVEIRALRGRAITIRTTRSFDRCVATATLPIDGVEARLEHVHLTLAGPNALRYAEIFGQAPDREVREVVQPP